MLKTQCRISNVSPGTWSGILNPDTGVLDPTKKNINIGDFGPPTFRFGTPKADFKGPAGIENINIEIKGARHNDFSYRVVDENGEPLWNNSDLAFEPERRVREINRKTNIFMRQLYQAALTEETSPGDLQGFLEFLVGTGAARHENGVWIIDPLKLPENL